MIDAAILLAAGYGTRLAPLSWVRAKAALPVAGEPIIRRQIRWLAAVGVRRVVVNLHHLPATITGLVGHGGDLGVDVRYSWEPLVLGSGGGPRRAFDLLGRDRAYIVNGDTLTDLDLEALAAAHAAHQPLVTMASTPDVTRGVIGVSIQPIPLDTLEALGLKERTGALVASVNKGGPADKAGLEPGDVIVEFNGKTVKNRDELVGFVTRTAPGSTVPVKVLRDKVEKRLSVTIDELNLDAETARTSRDTNEPEPDEQAGEGFGMTVGSLTQEMARRLRLPSGTEGVIITDVEAGSPAQRGGLARGDVLLQVNRRPVATVADAARELGKVGSGSTAFLLVLRNGQESFVTVRKE